MSSKSNTIFPFQYIYHQFPTDQGIQVYPTTQFSLPTPTFKLQSLYYSFSIFLTLSQWVLLNFFLLLAVNWESSKQKTWNSSPKVPFLSDTIFLQETTKVFASTPEKSPPSPTSLGTSPSLWIVLVTKTPWTT